jgi:hypothetical protein
MADTVDVERAVDRRPLEPLVGRRLIDDVAGNIRLASWNFPLVEHCSRQGDSPLDLWDFDAMVPVAGWVYLGWCPSASTCVPKSNWGKDYPIAVLLENSRGERSWCHVPATGALISAGMR